MFLKRKIFNHRIQNNWRFTSQLKKKKKEKKKKRFKKKMKAEILFLLSFSIKKRIELIRKIIPLGARPRNSNVPTKI
jgi:hypothetical protein